MPRYIVTYMVVRQEEVEADTPEAACEQVNIEPGTRILEITEPPVNLP